MYHSIFMGIYDLYIYIYIYMDIWIYNTFRVITDLKLVFRAITWGWWFCSVLLVKWFEGPRWSRKMETAWSGIFVDAGWYFWILGIYIIYCHIHLRKDANLSLSQIFSKTLRCRDFFRESRQWHGIASNLTEARSTGSPICPHLGCAVRCDRHEIHALMLVMVVVIIII